MQGETGNGMKNVEKKKMDEKKITCHEINHRACSCEVYKRAERSDSESEAMGSGGSGKDEKIRNQKFEKQRI